MNNSGPLTKSNYCIKEDASAATCPQKLTVRKTFAITPYPEIFLMNINWFSDHTSYMETFYFSISIAMEFNISEMFEVQSKSSVQGLGGSATSSKLVEGKGNDRVDERYMLMGIVCFVGAHYLSFVKAELNRKVIWKCFDDDKPIFVYQSWESVLHNII
ncbi:MAG: hypothetical protein ACPHN0_08195 [Candidatus Poseidoniaceae archaeon]